MLSRLSISNYALISSVEINFPDGLIIITGETGAGKSILLGALSLLLGKKADSSVFHDSASNCVVEAEFGDGTIIRRVITPAGRSRSFVNDEPVTLAELSALSRKIVDIHQQHQHLLLGDADYRLETIDYFAQNEELRNEYALLYKEHQLNCHKIKELKEQISQAQAQAEFRQFRYEKLAEANLLPGELEELESEHKILGSAERIVSDLYSVKGIFNNQDNSIVQLLKEASSIISKVGRDIPQLDSLSQRIDSCRIELDDIESEVETFANNVEVSPQRLEQVEQRMSLLYDLMHKYNCSTIEELISMRDSLATSLEDTAQLEQRLEQYEQQETAQFKKLQELAKELSNRRKESAQKFAEQLQHDIRSLEMPRAEIKIEVSPLESLASTGADKVDFFFGANGAGALSEISKVASGGELSRVMLALKSIVAKYTSLPTMIFDEIDTGVSGKIADKMGDMIGQMGENMQIFAITHLPQIASKKGAHYLVYKEFDGDGQARTYIKQLSEKERINEVARMLSGSQLTDTAILNAEELINRSK